MSSQHYWKTQITGRHQLHQGKPLGTQISISSDSILSTTANIPYNISDRHDKTENACTVSTPHTKP